MKIYFLSGLGADKSVFHFLDLSFCEPVFLDWIPALPGETLAAYALRMRELIPDEHPYIVGISFGGMLAVEIAKRDAAIKAFIISSAKTKHELPGWIRACKYFPAYKWLPDGLMRFIASKCNWLFGAEQKASIKIFKQIIAESNVPFNTWAVNAVVLWDNETVPPNVFHIHGTLDLLLPYRCVTCNASVKHGKHLMIMDHAEEVSRMMRGYFIR